MKDIITLPQVQPAETVINGFHQNEEIIVPESISEEGRFVSEEIYWVDYYSHPYFNYEWNNGRLEVKPVSDFAQYCVYLWFLALLKDYLHVYHNARMIGLEMGFKMKLRSKTTIRKPDLAVVLTSNPVPLGDKDRSYRGIFDICIESLSDSTKKEIARDTVTKKQEYAQAGVREYFILDDRRTNTAFYQLDKNNTYRRILPEHGIIKSSVLPGFQLRETDLYTLPEPPQMIDDPVYRDFCSPYVRQERLRTEQAEARAEEQRQIAEQERQRAEQERQRAEQEKRRADALAALVISLGGVVDVSLQS